MFSLDGVEDPIVSHHSAIRAIQTEIGTLVDKGTRVAAMLLGVEALGKNSMSLSGASMLQKPGIS